MSKKDNELSSIQLSLNKDKIVCLKQLLVWLEGKITSEPAIACLQQNKRLMSYYFVNLKLEEDEYDVVSDFIKNKYQAIALRNGIADSKKSDFWWEKFDKSVRSDKKTLNITIT